MATSAVFNIRCEFIPGGGGIDIKAYVNNWPAGYVWSIKKGMRLHLTDLHVDEEMRRDWPWFPWLFAWVLGKRASLPLRGKGVGKELLTKLLERADAERIEEVWGSVTPDDLRKTPYLLDFYRDAGFDILPPDAKCQSGAAYKIARRRANGL